MRLWSSEQIPHAQTPALDEKHCLRCRMLMRHCPLPRTPASKVRCTRTLRGSPDLRTRWRGGTRWRATAALLPVCSWTRWTATWRVSFGAGRIPDSSLVGRVLFRRGEAPESFYEASYWPGRKRDSFDEIERRRYVPDLFNESLFSYGQGG